MEAFFIYIAKSTGLIAMFYFAYYFLLRKETFFNSSRWFLLAGLLTSVLLPFVVYTQIVWIDPAPVADTVFHYNNNPAYLPQTFEPQSFRIDWNMVSLAVYIIGFAAFMLKFAIDFYSLNSVLKGKTIEQQADFKFIDINENIAPFSYFDYIVYNSSMYTQAELESILEHEKVHSDQYHTIDVLISRVFCILFWFNPVIWLYKKAILQNLEFIADSEASKKIADKKVYQYTLLKITTHENCVAITNHFYQSLIKKRIVMLNKNQSKNSNYWKYTAIIPALGAFILLFQMETIAQEKKQSQKEIVEKQTKSQDVYKINSSTTDQELSAIVKNLKTNHNVDVVISEVKRNSKNELINILVEIQKGSGEAQTIQIEGNNAIKECSIIITTENDGSKKINLITEGQPDEPEALQNDMEIVSSPPNVPNSITPPNPPAPPVFPQGPMPQVPVSAYANMPKPPVPPANPNDKAAVKKYDKEMAEFEKKMENYEPDMASFEKEIEEIMEKRSAIFDKEMEKYEIAMEKYNADMEKFGQDMEQKFGSDSEYSKNMKKYEIEMRKYENQMRQQEKQMRQQEIKMKEVEKQRIQYQKEVLKKQKEENRRS
ncbi:M56 family metallopeptidase [Flavobacterium reichenbachii]|uniref:Peptidase M56 n=1 Tax=Flavobacterium reichenbachii TaxID=362418 RepID=A0A085ZJU3_9FLAO|nr:M56 family metallopeptidase [Flavobacterium reichenbachii]KFF04707.1 peptidase M56 [Flavobacterium reichenbachii]OXB09901.1 peptidase M56 [Flavobacterium reichenbachii]